MSPSVSDADLSVGLDDPHTLCRLLECVLARTCSVRGEAKNEFLSKIYSLPFFLYKSQRRFSTSDDFGNVIFKNANFKNYQFSGKSMRSAYNSLDILVQIKTDYLLLLKHSVGMTFSEFVRIFHCVDSDIVSFRYNICEVPRIASQRVRDYFRKILALDMRYKSFVESWINSRSGFYISTFSSQYQDKFTSLLESRESINLEPQGLTEQDKFDKTRFHQEVSGVTGSRKLPSSHKGKPTVSQQSRSGSSISTSASAQPPRLNSLERMGHLDCGTRQVWYNGKLFTRYPWQTDSGEVNSSYKPDPSLGPLSTGAQPSEDIPELEEN